MGLLNICELLGRSVPDQRRASRLQEAVDGQYGWSSIITMIGGFGKGKGSSRDQSI
jgi:hypothetical protein